MSLWIVASIVFGILVGWAVTSSMKNQLKSVSAQETATDYVRQGSLKLTDKNDMFLYRHVAATPRASVRNSGSRGSGGGFSPMNNSGSRGSGGFMRTSRGGRMGPGRGRRF